jgi:hypothetical protein
MNDHPAGVPDAVILESSLVVLLLLHAVQRYVLGPLCSSTYRTLSKDVQFDADQRVLSLLFHVLQTAFNIYVLFFSNATRESPLYGYDAVHHVGFLLITAYYVYDAMLMLVHPGASNAGLWIFHHVFAAFMLTWQTSLLRMSALPASSFLISSAGHIANETRWFLRTGGLVNRHVHNVLGVACNAILFVACVLPPPWLVYTSAQLQGISSYRMLFSVMQTQCVAAYWFVWLPHCLLFIVQSQRTARHWNSESMRNPSKKSRK